MAKLPADWTNPVTQITHPIPAGYTRIKWQDVTEGQLVYTIGMKDNAPAVHGPQTVFKKDARRLKTRGGLNHWEPLQTLLVKN